METTDTVITRAPVAPEWPLTAEIHIRYRCGACGGTGHDGAGRTFCGVCGIADPVPQVADVGNVARCIHDPTYLKPVACSTCHGSGVCLRWVHLDDLLDAFFTDQITAVRRTTEVEAEMAEWEGDGRQ